MILEHQINLRVRYSETDQMGYVYYGNYPQYYEVGRVELLRSVGMSYRQIEENGLMLPVRDLQIRYIKPALYDDELTIKTSLREMPTTRITFDYEIFNAAGQLLNTASTTLVFVNIKTMRPCQAPENLLRALSTAISRKEE